MQHENVYLRFILFWYCSQRFTLNTYHFRITYIPSISLESDLVYDTEHLDGIHDKEEQFFLQSILDKTLLLYTDKATLKSMCEKVGIKAGESSQLLLISKLKEAVASKVPIDKFFFKVRHASGGLLCGTCPHGVVYWFKSLLKVEGPHVGDILLSVKHPPNVVISDIPHMLAAHVNKRSTGFFNPFDERVAEQTEKNISLALKDSLPEISLLWLKRANYGAVLDLNLAGTVVHPLTLVQQRLSVYDKLHEKNTKQRKEVLRRTKILKEMACVVRDR